MPRLFLALQPRPAEGTAIAAAARGLLQELAGKPVAPADLHLTLCFLGEVTAEASAALVRQVGMVWPIQLRLQLAQADCWSGARVLALVPRDDTVVGQAAELAARLRECALAAGIPSDSRPFRPHVTVGRGLPAAATRAMQWPRNLPASVSFTADGFVLMQSAPEGQAVPHYRAVHSWTASNP